MGILTHPLSSKADHQEITFFRQDYRNINLNLKFSKTKIQSRNWFKPWKKSRELILSTHTQRWLPTASHTGTSSHGNIEFGSVTLASRSVRHKPQIYSICYPFLDEGCFWSPVTVLNFCFSRSDHVVPTDGANCWWYFWAGDVASSETPL
jgi:hypothetical protein